MLKSRFTMGRISTRMPVRSRLCLLTFAALAGLGSSPTATRADEITLSLSTWGASSHPQVAKFTKPFMDGVTRDSGGKVTFKYFPDSQMVKQAAVPTAIPGGTVDIALTTLDAWAGRVPGSALPSTPLWGVTLPQSRDALLPDKPIFKHFDAQFAAAGTKVLALFDIGPAVISSKIPLNSPEDLQGRTVRAFSRATAEVLKTLGAAPVTLSVGDVYSALQRNAIDGALGGLQGAYGLRHYEVTSHVLASGGLFGTAITGYVMNKRRWDSLSPELKAIIQKNATEARNAVVDELIRSYDEYLKKMEEQGLKVVALKPGTPQWEQWKAALAPLIAKTKGEYPADVIKMVSH